MKSTIKRFFRFIKRLIEYVPIIWNDEDWDYACILRMLKYKLYRTRKHMYDCNIIKNGRKYCKQMLECENLIEQIIDVDDFCKEEWIVHNKKWGEPQHITIPIPGQSSSEWRSIRLNVRTKEDEIQENKEYRKIMFLEIRRQREAWNKLWKRLNQNMRNFWD